MKTTFASRPMLLVPLILVLSGCQFAPQVSLDTGFKESPVDIALGRQHQPQPTPPPIVLYSNPTPTFPAPLAIAPQELPVVTPVVPVACRVASPLDVPDVGVLSTARQSPAEGVYPFRFVVARTVGFGTPLAITTKESLPGTKEVKGSTKPDANGVYSFSMTEKVGLVTTDMTFTVYPNGPLGVAPPPGTAPNQTAGIYLTQMHDLIGNSFTPASPGVQIMVFPAGAGAPVSGVGTDPIGATTMEVDPTSAIKGKAEVDACGAVIDTWEVDLTGHIGNAKGGSGETTFGLQFMDATQYGGIPVATHLIYDYTDPTTGPTRWDIQDTISVLPKNPQAN